MPNAQRAGACTCMTPGSTVCGAATRFGEAVAVSPEIQLDSSFDSIAFTSERAARVSTSGLAPLTKITFAAQYDLYETCWDLSRARIGACVVAACLFSVR